MIVSALMFMQAAIRRRIRRFQRKALILLYHRVAELATDPQLLAVSPERFARQMEYLSKHCTVIRLRDLAEQNASEVDRCVAVSFDDGYADNFLTAAPILRRYEVPATVFVTTGYVGLDREFWWDELERVLLQPSTLPSRLHLEVNGWVCDRALDEWSRYSQEDYVRHRSWTVLNKTAPTVRHALYRQLCQELRPLSDETRSAVMEQLRVWSGAEPGARQTHQCLSISQVKSLASDGLMEVGAHSVSHSVLSTLPTVDQRAEICGSRDRLSMWTGRPIGMFAYPYGTQGDYTSDTAAIVREEGFSLACANFPNAVTEHEDLFQLPRVIVRNWDQDTFARAVDQWLKGTA
jgi:peptidoglycan/xylan/chitin deacetylase (PgdA/CDA1 family)